MAGPEHHILGGHLTLSIVTPEGAAYDGPADMVVVPAHDGEVAFLPGHAPYVGLLGAGELRFHTSEGGTVRFFLAGGVVQVVENRVNVLAESVVPAANLDVAKAQAELDAATALPAATPEAADARRKAVTAARAKVRVAQRVLNGAHVLGGTGPHA